MIYVKSILAGLAAVVGTIICIILAIVAIYWWQSVSVASGGVGFGVFAGGSIRVAATVVSMVALLIFTVGFRWEFRRLTHPR
jgi:hypothetical protein